MSFRARARERRALLQGSVMWAAPDPQLIMRVASNSGPKDQLSASPPTEPLVSEWKTGKTACVLAGMGPL